MADRVGSKGVMAVCFSLQTLPIVLLFFSTDAWHFYLFSVLFGIGFGGEMSAFPIINRQYYGSAPIGTTYGWQMMGAGVGMAAGSLIGRLAPRLDRQLRRDHGPVTGAEPYRGGVHSRAARHQPPPTAGLGGGAAAGGADGARPGAIPGCAAHADAARGGGLGLWTL